jgi:hypothetical protein
MQGAISMAEGMKIGAGHVDISADMTNLDNALGAMPAKVGKQFDATIQSMQAALARNKLEFKMLGPDDGSAAWRQLADELTAAQAKLKASLDLVKQAVVSKATAMATAAQATVSAKQAAKDLADAETRLAASAKQAAADQVRAARAAAQAAKDAAKVKAAADSEMQDSTGASTHKLQVFAQTLDDLQYVPEMGLRPILNNLTQISPALAVLGIGVQAVISNWGSLIGLMGSGKLETEAAEMERLGKATRMTADEADRLSKLQQQEAGKQLAAGAKTPGRKAEEQSIEDLLEKQNPAIMQAIREARGASIDRVAKSQEAGEYAKEWGMSAIMNEAKVAFEAIVTPMEFSEKAAQAERQRQAYDLNARRTGRVEQIARDETNTQAGNLDAKGIRTLIEDLEKLPDVGKKFPGLIGDLINALPENKAAQEQLERDGEVQAKQVRERMAEAKKEQAERERMDEKRKAQDREDARNKIEDEIKANEKVKDGLREDLERRKRVPETVFSGIDDYFKRIQRTVDKPAFDGVAEQIKRQDETNKILRQSLEELKRQQSREARLG